MEATKLLEAAVEQNATSGKIAALESAMMEASNARFTAASNYKRHILWHSNNARGAAN